MAASRRSARRHVTVTMPLTQVADSSAVSTISNSPRHPPIHRRCTARLPLTDSDSSGRIAPVLALHPSGLGARRSLASATGHEQAQGDQSSAGRRRGQEAASWWRILCGCRCLCLCLCRLERRGRLTRRRHSSCRSHPAHRCPDRQTRQRHRTRVWKLYVAYEGADCCAEGGCGPIGIAVGLVTRAGGQQGQCTSMFTAR